MSLVAAPLQGDRLRNCLYACASSAVRVRAAIAYADMSNIELFEECAREGVPLDYYGRYDHTCPVHPSLLRWFLKRDSIDLRCYLVPEHLHAKVIWWVDAGAYIGSANLTDRAWNKNYEAGMFYTREELVDSGLDDELGRFFERLHDQAYPLSEDVAREQELLLKRRQEIAKQEAEHRRFFAQTNLLKPKQHPDEVPPKEANQREFRAFEDEWRSTLTVLNQIAARVASDEWRPDWMPKSVPPAAQSDQFLHAYYYQRVRDGVKYPVEQLHHRNENQRDRALINELKWWKSGEYDHDDEFRHLTEWVPLIQHTFSRDAIDSLTEDAWVNAASCVHAIRDYAGKQSHEQLGLAAKGEYESKLRRHCQLLWSRTSSHGRTVRDLIRYVVWDPGSITERLWKGHRSDEWHIPGIGLSALGEIVGWSRSEDYPPRNMRTSKALRALGHPVRV